MNLPPVSNRTILITGCSTGIGLAACQQLRTAGWRVIASARKPGDLANLRAAGFETIALDMADAASVAKGAEEALRIGGGSIGALVNNAGFGQAGAIEDVTREALRYQFEVNVFGLQDLTNRLLPSMLRQSSGRIVHISSVLGRVVIPMLGAYCASKHAVEALADAQRVELRGTGVGVVLVEPGPIETEFRKNAAKAMDAEIPPKSEFRTFYAEETKRRMAGDTQRRFMKSPQDVAAVIQAALESARPRARYTVTLPARLAPMFRPFIPDRAYDAVIGSKLPARTRS